MKNSSEDTRNSRRSFIQDTSLILLMAWATPSCLRRDDNHERSSSPRLDRENLLAYRNKDGSVHPIHTTEEWSYRRRDILDGMQKVMGDLPRRDSIGALAHQVHWELNMADYDIQYITYSTDVETEAEDQVPAFLLIPNNAYTSELPSPGILSPLGTGQTRVTFSSENIEKRIFPLWDDHRDWPRELAQQGYVVLIPAYPHLGSYQPDLGSLGYKSGTMKAIWNNIRGMDLLDQLSFVKSAEYASIGHSLGGHNSLFTAAFDERIKVVVSSCGFDSFLDYMDGDIQGWTQELYMPHIADYKLDEIPFDFHEVVASIAPRACYVNAPVNDQNFKWRSAAKVVESAKPIYELFGVSDNLKIDHPVAEHSFPDEQRNRAYAFIQKHIT